MKFLQGLRRKIRGIYRKLRGVPDFDSQYVCFSIRDPQEIDEYYDDLFKPAAQPIEAAQLDFEEEVIADMIKYNRYKECDTVENEMFDNIDDALEVIKTFMVSHMNKEYKVKLGSKKVQINGDAQQFFELSIVLPAAQPVIINTPITVPQAPQVPFAPQVPKEYDWWHEPYVTWCAAQQGSDDGHYNG